MTTPIQARMIGANTCAALGITVTAGDPVQALCKRFVRDGWDPQASMTIWKGERPWRFVRSIGRPDQIKFQHRSKA